MVMQNAKMVNTTYLEGSTREYMHDAGICVTRLWTTFSTPLMDEVWSGYGEYNWDILDAYIYQQLSAHEDTYLMITPGFDAPSWWKEENSGEMVVTSEGTSPGVSLFSDKMYQETLEANKLMIAHMKEQPYWNRIIGAVLSSGEYSEWFWYGSGQQTILD